MYRALCRACVKVFVVFASLGGAPLLALAADDGSWKSGAEFHKQLAAKVSVTWKENPLRGALENLSRQTGVAIWIDRRVDPDQKVDFISGEAPQARDTLELTLRKLANHLHLGVAQVGPVVYLGPAETAAKLATLAARGGEQIRSLPATRRTALARPTAAKWAEFTAPRQLLARWAKESGVELKNIEELPHDLWAAGDFPPLTSAEYLTLLLSGFDRFFEFSPDGESLLIVALPAVAQVERTYTVSDTPGVVAQLKQLFPEAVVKSLAAGKVSFVGTAEQQAQVERLLRGEKVTRATVLPEKTVYTLKVENQPLGGVAKALAAKLGLEFKPDAAVREKLGELISFDVKNVSREGLLEALVKPAGVAFRVENGQLLLLAK